MPFRIDADCWENLKLCNCAGCNKEMLGESMKNLTVEFSMARPMPPRIAGRISDGVSNRPYCRACFFIRTGRRS